MDLRFELLCTLMGGLGIFYFGLKSVSGVMQNLGGSFIQRSISSLQKNRLKGFIIGLVTTIIVQNSSMIVMTVIGLSNIGLMPLMISLSTILGANIGTTLLGYIFSMPISNLNLLFLGVGFIPTLFSNSKNWKLIGKILFGIGMIFLGLQIMTHGLDHFKISPLFAEIMRSSSQDPYKRYLITIIVGILCTIILQASTAMLGITILLGKTGILNFETCWALVLGANIGTTLIPSFTSLSGNTKGQKVAFGHFIFNFSFAILFSFYIPEFTELVNRILPQDANYLSEKNYRPYLGLHLAVAHTLFNLVMAIFFLPFLRSVENFLSKGFPIENQRAHKDLISVTDLDDILPTMTLLQTQKELKKLKNILDEMFIKTNDYLQMRDLSAKHFYSIKELQITSETVQKEITNFTCKLMEHQLTTEQSSQTHMIVRIAFEFESVVDCLVRMAVYKTRFHKIINTEDPTILKLFSFFSDVIYYFEQTTKNIEFPENNFDWSFILKKSKELKIIADSIRDQHIEEAIANQYNPLKDRTYSDLTMSLRKIRGHIFNIGQSLEEFMKMGEYRRNLI